MKLLTNIFIDDMPIIEKTIKAYELIKSEREYNDRKLFYISDNAYDKNGKILKNYKSIHFDDTISKYPDLRLFWSLYQHFKTGGRFSRRTKSGAIIDEIR